MESIILQENDMSCCGRRQGEYPASGPGGQRSHFQKLARISLRNIGAQQAEEAGEAGQAEEAEEIEEAYCRHRFVGK